MEAEGSTRDAANEGSVTKWMNALRDNDQEAAAHLWRRYFHRLHGLARKRLGDQGAAHDDAEDAALSAFRVFCQAFQEGRYAELNDRDQFWALLAQVTVRKVNDHIKRETAQKRHRPGQEVPLDGVVGGSPPDVEAMMAEQCRELLDALQDPLLEQAALLKLDGFTNEEIAAQLDYSIRSVQYMLKSIRQRWQAYL